MENIAFDYGVAKSIICEYIKWIEGIIDKGQDFSLSKKRKLVNDADIEVDATECKIEHPKKNSGNTIQKKRKNTL